MPEPVVLPYGEGALLVQTEASAVPRLLAALSGLQDAEVVPGAASLLVRPHSDRDRASVREAVEAVLAESQQPVPSTTGARTVVIPVVYDGPDLASVAELTGLGVSEVVEAHTGRPWLVAFCGFAPGFAYLADGDPRLRVPRLAAPRTRVPAGSVGLAGEFSGAYPRDSPGGWRLIGRTDAVLWDATRSRPALLVPGTRVQFEEVR